MQYQVSRNGQTYGPYTLDDLKRYVASGNILPTDMAQPEGSTDWLAISQIIAPPAAPQAPAAWTPPPTPPADPTPASGGWNATPVPQAAAPVAPQYPSAPQYPAVQQYNQPQAYPPVNQYPQVPQYPPAQVYPGTASAFPPPPGMHWAVLLVLGFITCGIFFVVYEFIQAIWVKKVEPTAKVVLLYAAFVVLYIVSIALSFGQMAILMGMAAKAADGTAPVLAAPSLLISSLSTLVSLAVLITLVIYRFAMRTAILRHFNGPEPLGLRLSGVMTFFFGGLYFQYHFYRINQMRQGGYR